jgi:hypothetical protein
MNLYRENSRDHKKIPPTEASVGGMPFTRNQRAPTNG